MNWITSMAIDFEQMRSDLAELIKDDGYEKYFNRKTVEEKAEGMLKVIESCWIRESIFPLIPPTLEEYRKHYITSNLKHFDQETMELLAKRYGTVEKSKIREGFRTWNA